MEKKPAAARLLLSVGEGFPLVVEAVTSELRVPSAPAMAAVVVTAALTI